jgi:hypothetical protein
MVKINHLMNYYRIYDDFTKKSKNLNHLILKKDPLS